MKFIATDTDIHNHPKIRALNRAFPGLGFSVLHFLWSEVGIYIDIDNENPNWKDPEPVETLSEHFRQDKEIIESILQKLTELNLIEYAQTISTPKLIERETTQKYLSMVKGGRKGGKKKKNPPSSPLEAPSKNLNLNSNLNSNSNSKKEEKETREREDSPSKNSNLSIDAEGSYTLNDVAPPREMETIDQSHIDRYNEIWSEHYEGTVTQKINAYKLREGYRIYLDEMVTKDDYANIDHFLATVVKNAIVDRINKIPELNGNADFKGNVQNPVKLLSKNNKGEFWLARVLSDEFKGDKSDGKLKLPTTIDPKTDYTIPPGGPGGAFTT